MLGVTTEEQRILFLFEWKYTESYNPADLYIGSRARVYDPLITSADGPFVPGITAQALYYEPFYQMMRQTLLASLFEKHREMDCARCLNVHVVPKKNRDLKESVTSPGLQGRNIHDAWRKVLKAPDKYVPIDPSELLKGTRHLPDTESWLNYLKARYW